MSMSMSMSMSISMSISMIRSLGIIALDDARAASSCGKRQATLKYGSVHWGIAQGYACRVSPDFIHSHSLQTMTTSNK